LSERSVNESESDRSRSSPGKRPFGLAFFFRSGLPTGTGPLVLAKALVLLVLGCVALFGFLIGGATIVAEDQFAARRERFHREGTPVVETVTGKKVGRRTPYLIISPADSHPFVGEPGPGDGRWVKAAPATYERFQVGDRVELLRIGDDFFVTGDEFYRKFSPPKSILVGAIGVVAFLLVFRFWKVVG